MSKAFECLNIVIAMQERSDMPQYGHEGILKDMNLTEIHCLDCIGSIKQPNVTKVAEEQRLTRGAVSKICKKLIGKALIESYQNPDNKKEIYYRLSTNGKALFKKHQRVHEKVRAEWQSLFENYSTTEQETILRFLTDLSSLFVEVSDSAGIEKSSRKKSER